MLLARTARIRQSIHRIWYIKASSLMVLRGDLSRANSKMASLYREVTLLSTMLESMPGPSL
jgi:hypothetical protein